MAIPTGRIKIWFWFSYHFSPRASIDLGKLKDKYYEYSLKLSLSRDVPSFQIESNRNYHFQPEIQSKLIKPIDISINDIASQNENAFL